MWGWRRRRCSYCCPWGKSSLRIILRTKRWIIQLKLPPFDSIGRTLSLTFKFMFHPRLEWNHKCPFFYNSVAIICFIHKWNAIRKWAKLGSLCTQIKLGITLQDLKKSFRIPTSSFALHSIPCEVIKGAKLGTCYKLKSAKQNSFSQPISTTKRTWFSHQFLFQTSYSWHPHFWISFVPNVLLLCPLFEIHYLLSSPHLNRTIYDPPKCTTTLITFDTNYIIL
jgi:hypothetical protein